MTDYYSTAGSACGTFTYAAPELLMGVKCTPKVRGNMALRQEQLIAAAAGPSSLSGDGHLRQVAARKLRRHGCFSGGHLQLRCPALGDRDERDAGARKAAQAARARRVRHLGRHMPTVVHTVKVCRCSLW
jgi:hypothetical protein